MHNKCNQIFEVKRIVERKLKKEFTYLRGHKYTVYYDSWIDKKYQNSTTKALV